MPHLYQRFSFVCVEKLSIHTFGVVLNKISNGNSICKKYEIFFLDGVRVFSEEKIIPLNNNIISTLLSTIVKQNSKQGVFFISLIRQIEQRQKLNLKNDLYLFSTRDCLNNSNKFYSYLKIDSYKQNLYSNMQNFISNLPFNFCVDKEAIASFDKLSDNQQIKELALFFDNSFNSFYKKPLIIFEKQQNNWDSLLTIHLSKI